MSFTEKPLNALLFSNMDLLLALNTCSADVPPLTATPLAANERPPPACGRARGCGSSRTTLSGSGCRRSLSRPVWSRGVGEVAVSIPVVMADPGHGEGQSVFVAALGYEVKVVVGAD